MSLAVETVPQAAEVAQSAQASHPVQPASAPCRVRPADPASFTTRRMGPLRHDVDRHPLFQLDALEDLAGRLMPSGQCRFLSDTSGRTFAHDPVHPRGLSLEETFRRMEEPGSWLALYNVETDARYAAALERIVDDLRPGINVYTSVTRRTARVHQFNRGLRRLGVEPTFPGSSPALDAIKAPLGHWPAAARYRRLGAKAPPGSF